MVATIDPLEVNHGLKQMLNVELEALVILIIKIFKLEL
jgi:hypothetical protein